MDWLSDKFFALLELEWDSIVRRAAPGARVLWRSGGLKTDFIDRINITAHGHQRPLSELLSYQDKLAADLHPFDRVHTYGSFYIADLAV
jgi:S-adenosylmethionine-diacylglycerol 3-amino-3-carboxypropyl transferase